MVSPWQIEVSVALSETAGELVARPNAGSVKSFQPVNVRELRVGDGCGLVTTTPAFSHLGWKKLSGGKRNVGWGKFWAGRGPEP